MTAKRIGIWALVAVVAVAVGWYRSSSMNLEPEGTLRRTSAIFVTGGSGDYWKMTAEGARAAAKQFNTDLEVVLPDQNEGLKQQMQILMRLQGESKDGCAISPLDAEGQTFLINQLAETMDVVTFDSDAPLSQRRYYIGSSNYLAGQMCYELVTEALPDGGNVLVMLSNLTKNNMVERKAGYEESDVDAKWNTVDYLVDEGDQAQVRENIEAAFQENVQISCIVGMNGYHGPLLRQILAESGRLDDVRLIVFDESADTLAGIEAGEIFATISQDPYKYGFDAVRMLAFLHNGRASELPIPGRGQINVRCEAIRQDNLAEFKARHKERQATSAVD